METNLSQPIYFLQTAKVSDNMKQAFTSLNREFLKPTWISFENVERLADQSPGSVLVIDAIDSREAKKIRSMCSQKFKENRDVSPKYIALRVFTAFALLSINPREIKHLPLSKYPITSICMKNCHVTVSGFGLRRGKQISKRLFSMGAPVKRGLHERTRFVIADNWTTAKVTHLRRFCDAPCVIKPEWVERCWEMRENLKDAKEIVDQYKLPIFAGMHFCLSGFDTNTRTKMVRTIKENGGTYCKGLQLPKYKFPGETQVHSRSELGASTSPYTTHLIVSEKKGPKYEAAMKLDDPQHQIYIVNLDWLIVSRDNHFPQPENDPRFCARDKEAILEIKKAEFERNFKAVLELTQRPNGSMHRNSVENSQEIQKTQTSLDPNVELQQLLNSSPILDAERDKIFKDLSFFICGFAPADQANIKKYISRCGGTVYTDLVATVTHVICGHQMASKDALSIRRHHDKVRPICKVNLEWLLNCVRGNVLLPEAIDAPIEKFLNRIQSTQDLDQDERMEIFRARAETKATDMDNKLKELEAIEGSNGNRPNGKRRLRIGGGNSPIKITKITNHNETIDSTPCPILYRYEDL